MYGIGGMSWKDQGFAHLSLKDTVQCLDKNCILDSLRCDAKSDCQDGSDETTRVCGQNCSGVSGGGFTCSDGIQCIKESQKCDGGADCQDKSDETTHVCGKSCSSVNGGGFTCSDGIQCIKATQKCNGEVDCADRSDETEGACKEDCPPGNYRCSSGQCIDDIKKCDGDPHCHDGTDETALTCGQVYSMDIGDALKSATKTFVVNCEGRCEDIRATIMVDTGDPDLYASEHQPPQIG